MRPIKNLRQAARQLKKLLAPRGLILLYHRIAELESDPWSLSVTPSHFAEHLEVLKRYAHPMHLQQLAQSIQNGKIPNRAVAVTFDDGYADNLYNAKPLLERYGIPATIFLTTGYLGAEREFWWDELERLILQPGTLPEVLNLNVGCREYRWKLGKATYYGEADYRCNGRLKAWKGGPESRHALYYSLWQLLQSLLEDERRDALNQILVWTGNRSPVRPAHRCLSHEEVQALACGGLIEVGAHTVSHPSLCMHSLAFQQEEIQQSKSCLEDLVGRPVASFSYPHGDYTTDTLTIVRDAGFVCACSLIARSAWQYCDSFQLPRFQVEDCNGWEFLKSFLVWFHK